MSQMNNLDWKIYENITKYIYETLGQEFGISIEGYGNSFKVKGKSGVKHQIDVLTLKSDGTQQYRTAIECKYWNKKINKDTVMKLSKIIEDAEINNGIIVSKTGFSKDAVEFAKHCKIGLVQLRETEENDTELDPKKIEIATLHLSISTSILRPEILSIEIQNGKKQELKDIYQTTINLPNGKQIPLNNYLVRFQDELHKQAKISQIIIKRYEINGGSLTNKKTDVKCKIDGLTFTGVLKKIDENSNKMFSVVEEVWLIMKSIFEERTFSISKNGIIIQHKK